MPARPHDSPRYVAVCRRARAGVRFGTAILLLIAAQFRCAAHAPPGEHVGDRRRLILRDESTSSTWGSNAAPRRGGAHLYAYPRDRGRRGCFGRSAGTGGSPSLGLAIWEATSPSVGRVAITAAASCARADSHVLDLCACQRPRRADGFAHRRDMDRSARRKLTGRCAASSKCRRARLAALLSNGVATALPSRCSSSPRRPGDTHRDRHGARGRLRRHPHRDLPRRIGELVWRSSCSAHRRCFAALAAPHAVETRGLSPVGRTAESRAAARCRARASRACRNMFSRKFRFVH